MPQWTKCMSCINCGKRCQMDLALKDDDECDKYVKRISDMDELDKKII